MDLVGFKTHFWAWLTVFIFLIFLVYLAITIKNEKSVFLKNLKNYLLRGFKIPTPSWWTLVESNEQMLLFKRTDTHYEWQAKFSLVKNEDLSIEEFLVEKITEKKVLFDEDTSEIPSKERIARDFLLGKNEDFELARVEGTATNSEFDRLYLDMAVIRDNKRNLVLLCESTSSILNGAVEGPYFEEVLKRISV